jgi:hypothetical protein
MKNKLEQKLDAEFEREVLDQYIFGFPTSPLASEALKMLRKLGIYGVTICDRRDTFNRQRGRIIAKGRLLKHLKEIMNK